MNCKGPAPGQPEVPVERRYRNRVQLDFLCVFPTLGGNCLGHCLEPQHLTIRGITWAENYGRGAGGLFEGKYCDAGALRIQLHLLRGDAAGMLSQHRDLSPGGETFDLRGAYRDLESELV